MSRGSSLHIKKQIMARRLSETSPGLMSEFKRSDLISRLRSYRAQQRSDDNSLSISPQKRVFRHSRPGSAPFPNVLSAAWHIETRPVRAKSPVKFQEMPYDEKDHSEFLKFVEDLEHLQGLKFELELLYDVTRGRQTTPQEAGTLGSFFQIEEKLKEHPQDYLQTITDCSRMLRDVLRGVLTKGAQDEAIMMEMVWRIMVKQFEFLIQLTDQRHKDSAVKSDHNVLSLLNLHDVEKSKLQDLIKRSQHEATNTIKAKDDLIKHLQAENTRLEKQMLERDIKIAELTEMDTREVACIEMNKIFQKLSNFISEAEDEQMKQVTTLSSISRVMELTEKVTEKPESRDLESQTDLSLPPNPFLELESPIMSLHPLYNSYLTTDYHDVPYEQAISLCEEVLDEGRTDIPFVKQILMSFIRNKLALGEAVSKTLGICMAINQNQNTNKDMFFGQLMGTLSWPAERILLKFYGKLGEIDQGNGLIPLSYLMDFLKSYLASDRFSSERILASLNWTTPEFEEQVSKENMVLLCRFQIAIDKTKKQLKQLLDTLDPRKEGTIYRNPFVEWAKNKLGLWATEPELHRICDYFGGNYLKTPTVLERYKMLDLSERVKEIFVEKEELLVKVASECNLKHKELAQSFASVLAAKNFKEYSEYMVRSGKDPQDPGFVNMFTDGVLGIPTDRILRESSVVDQTLFKIEDSSKPPPKKAGKRGKK